MCSLLSDDVRSCFSHLKLLQRRSNSLCCGIYCCKWEYFKDILKEWNYSSPLRTSWDVALNTRHLRTRMTHIRLRRNLLRDAAGTGTNTAFVCFCSYLLNSLTKWIEHRRQPSIHVRTVISHQWQKAKHVKTNIHPVYQLILYLAPDKMMRSEDIKRNVNAAMKILWGCLVYFMELYVCLLHHFCPLTSIPSPSLNPICVKHVTNAM